MVYAAAIIAAGLVACHSRSGFLGLLVAGLVLIVCSRKRPAAPGSGWPSYWWRPGCTWRYWRLPRPSAHGWPRSWIPEMRAIESRLEVWQGAIRAWWAHPVWGSGLGSFPIAVIPYLSRDRSVFFARAENEYLDLLVEGGVLGLLLGLAFGAAIGCLACQAIRRMSNHWERDRGFAWGCVFGLIALSVQSLADFGPHVPAVGVIAITLCGQLAALAAGRRIEPGNPTLAAGRFILVDPDPQDSQTRRSTVGSTLAAGGSCSECRAASGGSSRPGPNWALGATVAWLGSVSLAGILLAHGVRGRQGREPPHDCRAPFARRLSPDDRNQRRAELGPGGVARFVKSRSPAQAQLG